MARGDAPGTLVEPSAGHVGCKKNNTSTLHLPGNSHVSIAGIKMIKARIAGMMVASCVALAGFIAVASAEDAPKRDIAPGPFEPTWQSLKQYECPEWFRDAKFGIWAHWTAQCVPEQGDWYARNMYEEGSSHYKFQVAHYGHPSKVGFKDIDNMWHAEHWDPEKLMELYKRAGAKYFVALANHHDNLDMWNSKYQPWNSVNIGPHKDIVGTWAQAARKNGLHFGVTVHCARSWDWLDVAHRADKTGPLAGVPYDGALTKADGKGTWWEGYDPADLYGPHGDARTPEARAAYVTKFFNRVKDLVDTYQPDLLYFDDSRVPLGEAGMNIYAHYYNASIQWHGGKNEAVINSKGMPKDLLKTLVHDFERGRSSKIEPYPWQTDTCIGDWHYKRSLYDHHQYKTPDQVVKMLVDDVSKNGNLLLNVPVRGDGTIDEDEVKFLEGMAAWMDVNSDCIFGTRPWAISSEGPVKVKGGGFSEGGEDHFTGKDFRFTTKGGAIYAIAMEWPGDAAVIKSLAKGSPLVEGDIAGVELLGCKDKLEWTRGDDGLTIKLPQTKPCDHAYAFKITGLKTVPGATANPEITLAPAADGSIKLPAEAAELHGSQIQTESHGDVTNIGFWDKPDEWASWSNVKVTKAGAYEISVSVAGPRSTEVTVDVAGQELVGKLTKTGDFETFQPQTLGRVEVKDAGSIVVKVRPRDSQNWHAVNLSAITLKPVQ
jgi:alpha-L-fucosidase